MHEEEPVPLNSSIKKVEEEGEICMPLRSSIGRPLRKAAEKVQSYKEPPLKSKMRRVEWSYINLPLYQCFSLLSVWYCYFILLWLSVMLFCISKRETFNDKWRCIGLFCIESKWTSFVIVHKSCWKSLYSAAKDFHVCFWLQMSWSNYNMALCWALVVTLELIWSSANWPNCTQRKPKLCSITKFNQISGLSKCPVGLKV